MISKKSFKLPIYSGSKYGHINAIIKESGPFKEFRSDTYNYSFNKSNGFFVRWGDNLDDDPIMSPAPEILDIEVTTICSGVKGSNGIESPCAFCYKSNSKNGHNMSFGEFKIILDKMPETLVQIAFGADSHATSNPDLFKMMEYTREKGIIPNITVADISDETADQLVKYCGGVAVSRYENKDICYDTVKKLTDRGLKQTNIHILVCQETFDQVKETIKDRNSDPRLAKLNAIVMLSLKRKGRGTKYNSITKEQYKELIDLSFSSNISIGFDSCSASSFLDSIKDRKDYKKMEVMVEPCEATLFSSYINAYGNFFPCSFSDKTIWKKGLSVLDAKDFVDDIWNHKKTVDFRDQLLKSIGNNCLKCRECVVFDESLLHPSGNDNCLKWE